VCLGKLRSPLARKSQSSLFKGLNVGCAKIYIMRVGIGLAV
jgi:hypothetical protein